MDICSGVSAPVTRSLLSLHGSCLAPIDADSAQGGIAHDLLQDDIFDFILRLAWSGAIGACLAAPPCSQYSRLRLKPGAPPALRDDKHVDGCPGLSPTLKKQVQDAQQIHLRCISVFGGHLEYWWVCMLRTATWELRFLRAHHCIFSALDSCGDRTDSSMQVAVEL